MRCYIYAITYPVLKNWKNVLSLSYRVLAPNHTRKFQLTVFKKFRSPKLRVVILRILSKSVQVKKMCTIGKHASCTDLPRTVPGYALEVVLGNL
jgi:hypothetical protein